MEYLGTVSDQTMSSIDLRSIINEARQEHGEGFFASCFITNVVLSLNGLRSSLLNKGVFWRNHELVIVCFMLCTGPFGTTNM